MEFINLAPELKVPENPQAVINKMTGFARDLRRDATAQQNEIDRLQRSIDTATTKRDELLNRAIGYELAVALVQRHVGLEPS